MKKRLLGVISSLIIIFLILYIIYKQDTKEIVDNNEKYGKITEIKMWYFLDNIEPRVIVSRMSNPKKGNIKMITLEKYSKLKEKMK